MKQPLNVYLPLSLNIVVTIKNDQPCLELRRIVLSQEVIKEILSAAFHERTIICLPKFNDKTRSVCSLVDKGILIKQDEKFYFNF